MNNTNYNNQIPWIGIGMDAIGMRNVQNLKKSLFPLKHLQMLKSNVFLKFQTS